MTDFKSLSDIRNIRPNPWVFPPQCAICANAKATCSIDGTLPDGQEAWFVPACDACAKASTSLAPTSGV